MVFVEKKKELGRKVGKVGGDGVRVELEKVPGSLEVAKKLDNPKDWERAAKIAYGVWEEKGDVEAGVFGVQMLVNLGDLNQAQEWLGKLPKDDLRVAEKRGWVDELMGKYGEAEADFQKVLDTGQTESPSYKTAVHFLGRAKYGLGKIGEARKQFKEDLGRAKREGNEVVQAFNLLWLARCGVAERKLEEARGKVEEVAGMGVIEPYRLFVEGVVGLEEGDIAGARESFGKAKGIWQTAEPYTRGVAQSLVGEAVCDLVEGREQEGIRKGQEAAKMYPWIWGNLD